MQPNAEDWPACLSVYHVIRGHHDAAERWRVETALPCDEPTEHGPGRWQVRGSVVRTEDRWDLRATAVNQTTSREPVSIEIALKVAPWRTEYFVFGAGAVYGGNRFPVRPQKYSPRLPEADVSASASPYITDIPRLSYEPGPSRFDMLAGEFAFPCVGFYDAKGHRGVLLVAESHQAGREIGITVVESEDRSHAEFRIGLPGVRAARYDFPSITTSGVSPDRAMVLANGEAITLDVKLHVFTASTLEAFFDKIYDLRGTVGKRTPPAVLPLSAAADLIIRKNNEPNFWNETFGFYATDPNPASPWYFQSGWCGGGIITVAKLVDDDPQTRERARRNLAMMLELGISPSGLFWGKRLSNGHWTADYQHDHRTHLHRWTLTRRQGDSLYFCLRQVNVLETQGFTTPEVWDRSLRQCADALLATFRQRGELGHYLDQYTGDILVGGSCSAGIVPAAWVLCEQRWGGGSYRAAACALGEQLYRDFVAHGVTTGGPGDAMQCPDSESVAAVLESFVDLADLTGDPKWLDYASSAAAQLSTWVISYDYPFLKGSEFDRLDMKSTGGVVANAQNKTGAPGICTHSGVGLLRLFRRTGDRRHIELLREIARSLPQFVSRNDRPIVANNGKPLPSGWINERINTGDWDNNLGGVFYGSTWCESAMLLTWNDLPGVYAQPDTGYLCVIDHLHCEWQDSSRTALQLYNPTQFDARVRVLAESSDIAGARPFPAGAAVNLPTVLVGAGETVVHVVRN